MKNILIIAMIVLFASCKDEPRVPKDYAVVHGNIKNANDSIRFRLYNPETSKSTMIEVDKDGNFRDTLRLENPAMFNAVYGNIFAVYLKNDMDLQLDFDSEKMGETISFKGLGNEENKFLRYKSKHLSELFGDDYKRYLGLKEEDFNKTTDKFMDEFNSELSKKASVLDSSFVRKEKADIQKFKEQMEAQHQEQLEIDAKLAKGQPSPKFINYTNFNGGTSSLADYKGSYVYMDVWATWCVPCIMEIPYLKKVEKEYEGKNIKFLSISADQPKDEQKWRAMIKDKDLHGVQLLADNAIESEFFMNYFIYGIPRFILLDPQGNIVSYDAPRPSEERLKNLFNSLDI